MAGRAQADCAAGSSGRVCPRSGDRGQRIIYSRGRSDFQAAGNDVSGLGVRDVGDFERVLADFAQDGNGGLIVTPSPLTATKRDVLIGVAEKLKLPTVYPFRFYVESGGLVSYGIDQLETVREAASYVDRILRGANPADLPVQLPTKFSLVVNLKTAKGLGLTVPESFLLFADEVIE